MALAAMWNYFVMMLREGRYDVMEAAPILAFATQEPLRRKTNK